jgi:outer membrane protein TolC/ribosomal protein L31
MKKAYTGLTLLIALAIGNTFAQKVYTLQQVVDLAKEQSVSSKLASTNFSNRYWQYRYYKSSYRPQLLLTGTVPQYERYIDLNKQDDGSYAFTRSSASYSSLNLSLNQNIAFTGSQVFASSSLQRIDDFNNKYHTYSANPAIIGINQPLLRFNNMRWEQKIEPLKYDEAKRQYNSDMEQVSVNATNLFFDLLSAQINLKIQQQNVTNNDTLYKISKGRYNLGKIAENELLQIELNLMNARNNLAQAELDMDLATLRMRNFLKLPPNEKIELTEPTSVPEFIIDENLALSEAQTNSGEIVSFKVQRLEAQRDVQRAKGDAWLNADLNASYGLTENSDLIPDLYYNPQDQQRLKLSFEIPIMDWGRSKSQVKIAVANRELVETNMEQAEQNFNQELFLLVKQFNMYRQKLVIAAKADTIAQKRSDITIKRYMVGKIGIIDLNLAMQEKDQARLDYLNALRIFWATYFDIRKRTLYDFEKKQKIEYGK